MKKIKTILFATSVLGMFAYSQQVKADTSDAIVSVANYNEFSGIFDVNAIQKANGKQIKTMRAAIWSEENGQDDLKWYVVSGNGQSANVQFNVDNHGKKEGQYITHVYIDYTDGTTSGHNLGRQKLSISKPTITQTANGVQLVSRILPSGNRKLVTAIWSEENGQDDIKWYSPDTNGNIFAPFSNHKGYGKYHVHTYLNNNGKMEAVDGGSIQVAIPKTNATVVKKTDTHFEITVNNVPNNITSITIPVWSEKNGQDDIKWYQATKVSEGIFKYTVNLKDHKFDLGHYYAHVYGNNVSSGKLEPLAVTGFDVAQIANVENPMASVANVNLSKGTFNVVVSETANSKAIKSMKTAIWSEANQSNIHWYEANTATNGKLSISADIQKHGNKTGSYYIHTYVTFTDGTQVGLVLPNQTLNQLTVNQAPKPVNTAYVNERNTYPVGQCTWGAKELAPWIPNWLGNGGQWTANARARGFRTGTTPRVGAVVSWDDGGYGHVAYVTHVESNNRIQIKEANYKGNQYIANFRGWFDPTAAYWGRVSYIYPD